MSNALAVLPHSIEAEQSVLGALLTDSQGVDNMVPLKPEHFYLADHAIIFEEILRQIDSGPSCDVISMMAALDGRIKDCGSYLISLVNSTPSAANIRRYSEIVREKAIKRALVFFGRQIAESAGASRETADAMLDQASSEIERLSSGQTKFVPVHAGADMSDYFRELDRRLEGLGTRIPTGFVEIDAKLNGGVAPGELIVVAARPKMGKTGFALNVACNVARHSSVLFLSMEMPRQQLHDRNVAYLGRIPLPHLLQPSRLDQQEWERVTETIQALNSMRLYLDDQGGLRLFDIKMKAKAMKRRHGLDLLIIDYLQLMDGEGDTRNAQIEGITRGLKSLAKELEIGIILLSQLNRDLEKRPNRRPQPSDLRDSGAIEQDADAVIFLYRDEVYDPNSIDQGICEVDIALCRQGAPGRVGLRYVGEQTRFESLPRPWRPQEQAQIKKGLAARL
ncbi:replicative DNA helicase [Massilia horti]|uniref:Replicative DNA helicase n=1 Tax=Massilia horti TaxID=2562153 RepID=A0A4Y9T323_9BURK|nr:replicative DNA helicase [Massilia horti]TFW33591.1 replicative DNA helicase [Massilia horti]